jgi:hypothetical protein
MSAATPQWIELCERASAHHEAAHGVAVHIVGFKIIEVVPHLCRFDFPANATSIRRDQRLERFATIVAAGAAGQQLYLDQCGFTDDYGVQESAARDIRQLRLASYELSGCVDENWIRERRIDATQIVRRHWRSIEAVATELLRRRRLTGQDIANLMRR